MIEQKIEAFKSIVNEVDSIISDEHSKIIEYEQLLSTKKSQYKKMPLLKKIFDKEKSEEINTLIEIIQGFSLTISEAKEKLKKEKSELIEFCKSNYLTIHPDYLKKRDDLKSHMNVTKEIFDVTEEVRLSSINALTTLESAIKELNEFNVASSAGYLSGYEDLVIGGVCNKFSTAFQMIAHLKKLLNYTDVQLKSIDDTVNTQNWEQIKTILNEDTSHRIIMKATRRYLNSQANEINNSLSCLQVVIQLVTRERNNYAKNYNNALDALNLFSKETDRFVKETLETAGIKI